MDLRLRPLGESLEAADSGHRGSGGPHGPGLTWGPTVQQLHKVGWKGSQPPAVLNLGRRDDAGASGSAPRASLNI